MNQPPEGFGEDALSRELERQSRFVAPEIVEDLRTQLAVAKQTMRGLANGTRQLVFFGGRGCLTDDCDYWNDNTCNAKDPYCRIGRTIEITLVKEQKP